MLTHIKKWNIFTYARQRTSRIGKFLVIGGSAALLSLLILYVFVEYLGFNTKIGENAANLISMELATIYNFFMMRAITWRDRHKESGGTLIIQIIKFHTTVGITLLLRLVLFALLQLLGMYYILNAAIGMLSAAAINFVAYDTMIFKKRG